VALFKLVKFFESELEQLEQNKSKCFLIRKWHNYRIIIIKDRIRELKEEIDLRKRQPREKQDYK
jgi:hypothetical protein